jgi:hypothetical protein
VGLGNDVPPIRGVGSPGSIESVVGEETQEEYVGGAVWRPTLYIVKDEGIFCG